MTEADVEVVRTAFSGWERVVSREQEAARSEAERLTALAEEVDAGFHSDVEYREDPQWPGSSSYRGIDQVKARVRDGNVRFFEAYVDPHRALEAAGVEDTAS